jgi:hypothetical protein
VAVESAADRAAFFDTDEHGLAATFTPDGGEASTVNGIFSDNHVLVLEGDAPGHEASAATFLCQTSDVAGVDEGDALDLTDVTGAARSFTIKAVEHDGAGMTRLVLEE